MSIQSEINRIEQNIANAYSTLSARGATLPAEQNSENLANTINEFEDPVVNAHIANKNNPHGVTAEQIGAASKEYVDNAVANAGGGSGVHIGADEPEDGDVWIDTDDESDEPSNNFIPNGGDGDYFLKGHLSFESSASDLLFSSDGISATVYEQEGLEAPVSRPIITVTTHDDDSNAIPFTTIAPGITHVGYDEYSDNTDIRAGRIEFYNQDGTVKIGITGDAQEVYDPDADSYVIGLADGDDSPIIVRGVNWPTQPNDATNKEYVDSKIAYGTEEVEAGSASIYPEGTLYVVIE